LFDVFDLTEVSQPCILILSIFKDLAC